MATRAFSDAEYAAGAAIPTALQKWSPSSPQGVAIAALRQRVADDTDFGPSLEVKNVIKPAQGDFIFRDMSEPDGNKGALYAGNPDEDAFTDVLLFSRYPTQVEYDLETNLSVEHIAGRALPAIQDLGSKGVKISLDVLFYDAWIDFTRYKPAYVAQKWFDAYVIRNDGTGLAMPVAPIFYQLGAAPPVPVKIESVKLIAEHFDRQDHPQSIRAQLTMHVYLPLRAVSPFKPRDPVTIRITGPKKKKSVCGCPTTPGGQQGAQMPRPVGDSVSTTARELSPTEKAYKGAANATAELRSKALGLVPQSAGRNGKDATEAAADLVKRTGVILNGAPERAVSGDSGYSWWTSLGAQRRGGGF